MIFTSTSAIHLYLIPKYSLHFRDSGSLSSHLRFHPVTLTLSLFSPSVTQNSQDLVYPSFFQTIESCAVLIFFTLAFFNLRDLYRTFFYIIADLSSKLSANTYLFIYFFVMLEILSSVNEKYLNICYNVYLMV